MQGLHGGKRRKESSNEVFSQILKDNLSYKLTIKDSIRKSSKRVKIAKKSTFYIKNFWM